MDSGVIALMRSAIGRVSSEVDNDDKTPRVAMVVDVADTNFIGGFIPALIEKQRHPYCRPEFLYFSEDDIILSADQAVRPVICAKIPDRMPLNAGYAEVINAGKTKDNEDQASAKLLNIVQQGYEIEEATDILEERNGQGFLRRYPGRTGKPLGIFPQGNIKEAAVSIFLCETVPSGFPVRPGCGLCSFHNCRPSSRRLSDEALLTTPDAETSTENSISGFPRAEAALFSIFDGHAGSGASIMSSRCLHEHVKSRLSEVLETILHLDRQDSYCLARKRSGSAYSLSRGSSNCSPKHSPFSCDSLVVGAMEAAFVDMDEQIAEEKQMWKIPGGCAVISALVFLGKVYVANAGDCRAVLVTSDGVKAMSQDFTPATERKRLQTLAYQNPELLGNHFSRLEYSRFLGKKDLKKKVLYRDWFMDGWAAKNVRESDLKPPMISDRLRKKRLLHTIGVSRGFGDHHLLTADDKLPIKPFLSPVPEVRVFDIRSLNILTDKDVLILASDGLWDVLSNEDAARIVQSALSSFDETDVTRYTMAAQELIIAARGNPSDSHRWTMNVGGPASMDDITVFVIPLKHALVPPKTEEDDDDDMLSLDN